MKTLLPTLWKLVYSCAVYLTVNESGCTTVSAAFWNDKGIRLAFCVFLTDVNYSFGWSECNFCSKVVNDSLLIAPFNSVRDISALKKIPLHIHLRLLSYFSKCNYPARLNYGKEIIKIFSCQMNLASTFFLVWLLGIVSFYSFSPLLLRPSPTPVLLNPTHSSVRLISLKVDPLAGHHCQVYTCT